MFDLIVIVIINSNRTLAPVTDAPTVLFRYQQHCSLHCSKLVSSHDRPESIRITALCAWHYRCRLMRSYIMQLAVAQSVPFHCVLEYTRVSADIVTNFSS